MKTPLGTEVDLGPGHIVIDGDPVPPIARGAQQSRLFSADVFLWPRSPISATAELLFSLRILFRWPFAFACQTGRDDFSSYI